MRNVMDRFSYRWGHLFPLAFAVALGLSLAGCGAAGERIEGIGDSRESMNDIQRDATMRAVKDISLGSWARETDLNEACGAALIAGIYDRMTDCSEWPTQAGPTVGLEPLSAPVDPR